jgi:hypothetical protein
MDQTPANHHIDCYNHDDEFFNERLVVKIVPTNAFKQIDRA